MGEFVSIDSGYVSIDSQSSRRFVASSSVVTNGPVCCLVTAAAGWPARVGAKVRGNLLPPHSPLTSPVISGALQITNLAGLSIIWRLEACVESWSWLAEYLQPRVQVSLWCWSRYSGQCCPGQVITLYNVFLKSPHPHQPHQTSNISMYLRHGIPVDMRPGVPAGAELHTTFSSP